MTIDPGSRRIKTDYDPNWQNLEPKASELTNINGADPHYIRFSVHRALTKQEQDDGVEFVEVAQWLRKFPTRDAADSEAADIRMAMGALRGEPEQAWSDIAKASNCPNPAILPLHKNLHMQLIPCQPNKSEPIPHDDPRYAQSFAAKHARRDAVTGLPHPKPGGASPAGTEQASSGPDGERPARVRKRATPAKSKLPERGRKRSPAKGKAKQGKTKTGGRGRNTKHD